MRNCGTSLRGKRQCQPVSSDDASGEPQVALSPESLPQRVASRQAFCGGQYAGYAETPGEPEQHCGRLGPGLLLDVEQIRPIRSSDSIAGGLVRPPDHGLKRESLGHRRHRPRLFHGSVHRWQPSGPVRPPPGSRLNQPASGALLGWPGQRRDGKQSRRARYRAADSQVLTSGTGRGMSG